MFLPMVPHRILSFEIGSSHTDMHWHRHVRTHICTSTGTLRSLHISSSSGGSSGGGGVCAYVEKVMVRGVTKDVSL
jgi:hypothetical protein